MNGQVYTLDENPLGVRQVLLAFSRGKCVVTLCDAQGEHPVVCGLDRWVAGETDLSPDRLHLVTTAPPGKTRLAAGGAWSDQKTLVMDWRFVETAHYQRVTCRFEGDTLRLEIRKSLALLNPAAKDSPLILIGKRVTV